MRKATRFNLIAGVFVLLGLAWMATDSAVYAQGVTTADISGVITDDAGAPLHGANVIATHEPSGTIYGAVSRSTGAFNILNLRIGGPYTVKVQYIGYRTEEKGDIHLSLGRALKIDFKLVEEAMEGEVVEIIAEVDDILNSDRTGAATFIDPDQVKEMPSIKRSTRDLTRLDPRSDGNYSFGGKNWLYNNISLDGSYFNNSFGLDDPSPGGQTNAEPVPFDAIEQVQVSVAPFDVRQGGFTGANINQVTKSGTNDVKASVYTFFRNESLIGNEVSGNKVIANPDLTFTQSGFSVGGPIMKNKLFFFLNAEIERREDPGSNFVPNDGDGQDKFGESRVLRSDLQAIRDRLMTTYGYDTGPFEDFLHNTKNEKFLLKLDWNIDENHNASFRYNFLDARQDKPPHPFVLSPNASGRGPNESSLPFRNSGYRMNNELNSFALELNSRWDNYANRLFVSYSRFRDFRSPFSADFPTIDIAQNGVTYTTVGHEPFSIHNILDQDVWQFTNNFSYFKDKHVITVGANYEIFDFFNAFNLFRHGVFFLPWVVDFEGDGIPNGSTFGTIGDPDGVQEFLNATGGPTPVDLNGMVAGNVPFKGEDIKVSQFSVYAQDEYLMTNDFNLTFGVRVDMPIYNTDPVANPFSTDSLQNLLDENDKAEVVNQAKLADATPLFSPRVGFNWDVRGDRTFQLRGGTGIFTGRLPFVWIGNVISNPGANPNLPGQGAPVTGKDDSDEIPTQSFDLNAMVDDFKWPQAWTTDIAVDYLLPWDVLGTFEFIYSKDLNSVVVRNADLRSPVRTLADGRPFFADTSGGQIGFGSWEINPDGDAGAYVLDNSSAGYNYNFTVQLRKQFESGVSTMMSYSFLEAKSKLKSTEIASVLFADNPTQGDPNKTKLSNSEFGNRHRIIGALNYKHHWNKNFATSVGVFLELAEGNRFAGAGGNRYSFTYAGDVNGDGRGGNDLIYIPRDQSEITFDTRTNSDGSFTSPAEQWAMFDALIRQDDYLSENRGKIAERFGAVNPWFTNIDLRILQDFNVELGGKPNTFQVSLDILNFANLLNSDWGVREVANSAATTPLQVQRFDANGEPVFTYVGPANSKTYVDDPGQFSRWQVQLGLRYLFN